jgi:hypothetical protein
MFRAREDGGFDWDTREPGFFRLSRCCNVIVTTVLGRTCSLEAAFLYSQPLKILLAANRPRAKSVSRGRRQRRSPHRPRLSKSSTERERRPAKLSSFGHMLPCGNMGAWKGNGAGRKRQSLRPIHLKGCPHNCLPPQPVHGRHARHIRREQGEPVQEVTENLRLMGRSRLVDEWSVTVLAFAKCPLACQGRSPPRHGSRRGK